MDTKSVLKWKGMALCVALLIVVALFWGVRHFFYILDSYYYTLEFHVLFMINNLIKANTGLFVEYFSATGSAFSALPSLFLAHSVQSVWAVFTKPILPGIAILSLGVFSGTAVTFVALFLIGMLLYGLGCFFLGDIMPFVRGTRNGMQAPRPQIVGIISGLCLAVPYIPIFIAVGLAAVLKAPFKRMIIVLVWGLMIRMAVSVLVSGL